MEIKLPINSALTENKTKKKEVKKECKFPINLTTL